MAAYLEGESAGVGWASFTSRRVPLSGLLTSLVLASVSELVNEQFLCRIQLPSSLQNLELQELLSFCWERSQLIDFLS